jgi:hypothetical protein
VKYVFSKDDAKSVFVSRPEKISPDALLCLRLKGQARPIILVRDRLGEIETAHRTLCEVLRSEGTNLVSKPTVRI